MAQSKKDEKKYRLFGHFSAKEIFTIPNVLTYIRIILIPVFVYLYVFKEEYTTAIIIAIVACLTDLVDGWIARKFNMTSALGKTLDPFADKLMQGAFVIALVKVYPGALILFGIMVLKELLLAYLSYRVVKQVGIVIGSRWYGRVATWIIDITMAFLLIFNQTPKEYANIIFIVNGAIMIICLVLYAIYCEGVIRENKKNQSDKKDIVGKYANKKFEVPEMSINSEKREALKGIRNDYKEAKKEIRQGKKELRKEQKDLRQETREKRRQVMSGKSQEQK